jgi:DNA primase
LTQYEGRSKILLQLNNKEAPRPTSLSLPGNDTLNKGEQNYLLRRHFIPTTLLHTFAIRGGGIVGAWKYRIIIPLFVSGKLISWTARTITNNKDVPRYKNLSIDESIIDPKRILFNLDNSPGPGVMLLEGVFDVMRMGHNAICSFGTSLTQSQIKVLSQRYKRIYILFDNEKEAQQKAVRYGLQLTSIGVQTEIIDAFSDYNKNDAGELLPGEARKIKKELHL